MQCRDLVGVVAQHLGLDHQALFEVASGHADGIESLDQGQHLTRILGVETGLLRQIVQRQVRQLFALRVEVALEVEVTLLVEVADHEQREVTLRVDEVAHLQLPQQVVVQGGQLGEVLLDRWQLVEAAPRRAGWLAQLLVFEVAIPVDVVRFFRVAHLGLRGALALRRLGSLVGRGDRLLRRLLGARCLIWRGWALSRCGIGGGRLLVGLDGVVREHRIAIELLADLVDQLHA